MDAQGGRLANHRYRYCLQLKTRKNFFGHPAYFRFLQVWIFVLLSLRAAPAQEGRFERIGPYGGTVRSLLISPRDSRIVYLGTNDGQIFKSVDGGLSWRQLFPGIRRRQLVIKTLVEDPSNSEHVYAGGWDIRSSGGGLFESRDGGESWTRVKLPKPEVAVRGFAISKGSPAHMILGTGSGIFVSANGGRTWLQRGVQMKAFLQTDSVAIDPKDPRILYVGTWRLGYRSKDFGRTWVQNGRGMILDSDVFSISIDERNPKTVFASACTGLYRSIDQGVSWTRLKVFPKSFLVRAHVVQVHPAGSKRVYGGTTEGLFVSADSGRSWKRVTPNDWIVNAVQIDPRNGDVILMATERHGILRSVDGGMNWKESNKGFSSRSITRVLPDPDTPGRVLVGEFSEGKDGGFHIYENPEHRWLVPDKKDAPGQGFYALTALPRGNGRIAGTARGAFLENAETGEWSALAGPIGKLPVYDLALDGNREWIFAGTNDGVYRAPVGDPIFRKLPTYAFIPRVFTLLTSPANPKLIFAGTHLGVITSKNCGDSWAFATQGIPEHAMVESLAASPADEQHIFAGTTAGLYESRNGGAAWSKAKDGRLGVEIAAVIFLDRSGERILAADSTHGGVFLSEDGGARWQKIAHPEYSSPVRALAQDPLDPTIVYLGTHSEGVYRLSIKSN